MKIVALKKVSGSPVRMMPADTIDLLNELERAEFIPRVASGVLMVNAGGKTMPKELSDRVKKDKPNLVRLIGYCEAVP